MNKKRRKAKDRRFQVLEGQGRRFSFSSFKQAFVYYVLLLLALVVIVQLGQHWLGDQFLAWRLRVVAAEPGLIEKSENVAGVVIRREEIITAPGPGMVLRLAEPGERVPAGAELVTFGVISLTDMQRLRGGR